jgi:hypothetical protein
MFELEFYIGHQMMLIRRESDLYEMWYGTVVNRLCAHRKLAMKELTTEGEHARHPSVKHSE